MTKIQDDNWYSDAAATFGDRVAAAREAREMSRTDLARRLGIAVKTLDGWEHDLSEPRANKLQMLAGMLNVSMTWLLTGEGPGLAGPEARARQPELGEVLAELRGLKDGIMRSAERVGQLESRLAALAADAAE